MLPRGAENRDYELFAENTLPILPTELPVTDVVSAERKRDGGFLGYT